MSERFYVTLERMRWAATAKEESILSLQDQILDLLLGAKIFNPQEASAFIISKIHKSILPYQGANPMEPIPLPDKEVTEGLWELMDRLWEEASLTQTEPLPGYLGYFQTHETDEPDHVLFSSRSESPFLGWSLG